MKLWDRLLLQAELTLNLLRQSNTTPTISAYAHLYGPFDYNRMPLAPLGCPVQIHEPPAKRGTWNHHSKAGWYLGTSKEHYRSHTIYVKETRAERNSETVFFKHKYITNPSLTHGDMVVKAAQDLCKALEKKPNHKGDEKLRGLKELSTMFLEMAENEPNTTWERQYVPKSPPVTEVATPRVKETRSPPRVPTVSPISNPTQFFPPEQRIEAPATPIRASPTRLRVDTSGTTPLQRVSQQFQLDGTPTSSRRSHCDVGSNPSSQFSPTFTPTASPPNTPTTPPPQSPPNALQTPPSTPRELIVESVTPAKSEERGGSRAQRYCKKELEKLGVVPGTENLPSRRHNRASRSEELANLVFALDSMVDCYVNVRPPPKQAKLEVHTDVANAVLDHETGKMMNYRDLLRHPKYREDWSKSSANEFGRLAQGVGDRVEGTDTIFFIHKHEVPSDRFKDVTYASFVCTVRPQKLDEPNRTRLVIGGNNINYPFEVGTPTAEMLLAKILWNSIISTKGGRFMTIDIKNFYLMTPLKRPEYFRMKLSDIPQEIIDEYKLLEKATPEGWVYVEVRRGMYGLPQGGLLAQQQLEERLNEHGYYQDQYVPGLWHHKYRPIKFTLVVDDFGVKYVRKQDAEHLVKVLSEHYTVTEDWTGSKYIGITLDWDYAGRKVHLSMPGYVPQALTEFGHVAPTRRQDSPFPHTPPRYGAKIQYATAPDESPKLDNDGQKFIQRVNGKFLYVGRAVDSTLLTPLSAIATQQAAPTEETEKRAKQLLDYVASQEEAILTYKASDMILAVHSDAGYLNEPNARSRAGGHFFLSNNDPSPPNNGAILNVAQIIKSVMSSAAEAELGALYINAREAVYIRLILERMGHPQPPTPIQTDNSTAEGVINNKVQPKRTKAMDMRFHWLRDRETLKQFRFYWRPGRMNYADYWTKHHPAAHHRNFRPEILTPESALKALRESLKAQITE